MMDTYVFGYGSLINRMSIARTTVRVPALHELAFNRLIGYERLWDYQATVLSESLQRPVAAVYLNIRVNAASTVNGVTFAVDEEELDRLRKRERFYEMIDCTAELELPVRGRAVTFICTDPEHLAIAGSDAYVLKKYTEIVATGCADFGPAFAAEFERSTLACGFPILDGGYSFL